MRSIDQYMLSEGYGLEVNTDSLWDVENSSAFQGLFSLYLLVRVK